MGAVKELIMEVEDLVWEAMETGAKTKEDIYAYVMTNLSHGSVGQDFVYELVDAAEQWPDDGLYWSTQTIH
jgi:hypothetical protein